MQALKSTREIPPDTFLIGVAGHKDLLQKEKLTEHVEEILIKLKTKHEKIILLCLGAIGADQLTVAIAARLGIEIAGIYIIDYNDDKEHLQDFRPNQEWLDSQENQPGFRKCHLRNRSLEKKLEKAKRISDKEKQNAEFKTIVQDIHAENSKLIAGRSDYLIALWDGVDNGKTGGTAETVHIALHQKDFKGQPVAFSKNKKGIFGEKELRHWKKTWRKPKGLLYQIVSPREKNPFPLGRFPARAATGIPNAEIYETGSSPFPLISFEGNRWHRGWMIVKNAYHHGLFLHYILPAAFVLLTVGLGSFGFKDLRGYKAWKEDSTNKYNFKPLLKQAKTKHPKNTVLQLSQRLIKDYNWNYLSPECWPQTNDLFKAINLLTFGSSADIEPEKVPRILTIARWTGLLFVINAFLIAYLLAIGKNHKVSLKISWRAFWGMPFYLLAGLNEKSYNLAKDLKRQGRSVVIIDGEPDANKMVEAEKKGILVYKANSFSAAALSRIKAASATKVFLLHEDDVNSIRSLQELSQLKPGKFIRGFKQPAKIDRYIHLSDNRYKDFVCKTNPDTHTTSYQVFNIYENTARRLLLKYPVYRFKKDQSPETAGILVFGFGEMAEQLVLSILRSGFYSDQKNLKITVFALDHKDKADSFYKKYPVLWYNNEHNRAYEKPHAQEIRAEIFPENVLTFKELPLSDAVYFSDETIHEAITNKHIVSIYFCLPQSMQSAAYLYALLPKIQYLQDSALSGIPVCDVQCFCHYNLQDKDEVEHVEHIVNSKIPNSPVIFFGSLTEECTEDTITSRSDDLLPKLINVWYNHDKVIYDNGKQKDIDQLFKDRKGFWLDKNNHDEHTHNLKQEAEHSWKKLSITKKESNRYAADHLWIKLYLLDFTYKTLSEILKDKKKITSFSLAFTEISKSSYSDKIAAMAKVEHRRWCAEKLLEGFLPAQDFDPLLDIHHAKTVSNWNSKKEEFKEYKSYFQEQKLHIDLLPFNALFEGNYGEEYFNEKIKDISLVEAIPYLIFALIN